jgi:hypothetical protein
VTALAILAFLGDGSTTTSGPYAETLEKGCEWLVKRQRADGGLGSASASDSIYDHVLATYALCEASGLSNDEKLRKPAQSGIDYLEAHRNPYAVWGLAARDNRNDTSVTCWAVMAYRSATDFKLRVNTQAFQLAATWLDQVTGADGIVGLHARGDATDSRPIEAARLFGPETRDRLTAAGLLARFFLGQVPSQVPLMTKSADAISRELPKDGSFDPLACYWTSYALYQVGGRHWTNWSQSLTQAIVASQRAEGSAAGSWDPPAGTKGLGGGRVMSTALAALTVEAYYRYTRLVR